MPHARLCLTFGRIRSWPSSGDAVAEAVAISDTVRVRALFFASYRDWAGVDALDLDLAGGATVADAVAAVRKAPGLDRIPAEPVVAVNEAYARPDAPLADGDEIAFIPPVSGGS